MRKRTPREELLNYRFDDIYLTAHNDKKVETIKLSNDNIIGGDIILTDSNKKNTITVTPLFVPVNTSKPLFKIRNIKKIDININDIKYNIAYSINNISYNSLFEEIIKLYPSNKSINRSLDLILIPSSEKPIL